ncbi:hypothetical protein [Streptomyces sp. 2131.1]|uniref:hypothetical protein n=1 Tax=Streptomyces sp. 2131.1 TaxID=1855346 RepID=UPI00210CB3B4|nr:hypothetical protein [Streptomyces sp. 2131.1]
MPLPVPDGSLDAVFCASSLHFLGRRALTDVTAHVTLLGDRRAAITAARLPEHL